jgi:hypothetical protein
MNLERDTADERVLMITKGEALRFQRAGTCRGFVDDACHG